MLNRAWFRLVVFLCVLAVSPLCQADPDNELGPCDDGRARFPEAAEYLESLGLPAEDFTVLLTWRETARHGPRQLITGYHILPVGGREAFDLYRDSQGNLLDADQLAAIGVPPKDWRLPPIERFGEAQRVFARVLPSRPTPVGPVKTVSPGAALHLPPIDLDRVFVEDQLSESTPTKGAKRIGVFQKFPKPVCLTWDGATLGNWQTLDDAGRLWSTTIHSPEAKGQRVHFRDLAVPDGGHVIVYNAHDPNEAYGPYRRPYPGETDLWTPTCFSDALVVECYVPAGLDAPGLRLTIDRIAHIYVDFDLLQWQKAAGACNLDVACYPDWITTSMGIGGIGAVGTTGVIWCTGTLLVDTAPATDIPYFLTADHCVGGQDGPQGASSVEVYWLYQRDACDGAVPGVYEVPRTTGGADYLAGASETTGSDFALLRLRSQPPAEVSYAGWACGSAGVGTDVTCIHHPSGDYKRISFGTITNSGSPTQGYERIQPISLYHEVIWNNGTTEHGSSGSPLTIEATQQVIGQLWGGLASCSDPDEPDYFGRFDVTFPLVREWLTPGGTADDLDGDGIPDSEEGTGDRDGDGIPNYLDPDSDGDTIPDLEEGNVDWDFDGTPNYLDTDSDDDTIPDAYEGSDDPDDDGIPNYLDSDSDQNGLPDAEDDMDDLDDDGAPGFRDMDDDGDGIDDTVEGTDDPDEDGMPNYRDTDSDGDGIPDSEEGAEDVDDDETPNYLDLDSDGDTLLDADEGAEDVDGDGLPNYLDVDSDGDDLPDGDEVNIYGSDPLLPDTDGDQFWDGFEVAHGTDPTTAESYPHFDVFGDVNIDGVVDAVDVQLVIRGALALPVPVPVDLDGSATVDAADVQLAVNTLLASF